MRMFLCGDVMLGRGIDQLLPASVDPVLREPVVEDARRYIELAERVSGPIDRPVEPSWPWGEALDVLSDAAPDVRVINLETSVTTSTQFDRDKSIHYRMSPSNLTALTVAAPHVCVLANNHVLDFGRPGLEETLASLAAAGVGPTGAGRDEDAAWAPTRISVDGRDQPLLLLAVATPSSGVPGSWAAGPTRPGVAFFDPAEDPLERIVRRLDDQRRRRDRVVVSIHWGSNWGYDVPSWQVRLAHALIEAGVDVVHGHSSHHPRPIEVHRGKLILYGCGDLINDYEGIGGHERYRSDLRPLYLVDLDPGSGELTGLQVIPMRSRRLRLEVAPSEDRDWQRDELDRISRPFGVSFAGGPGLALRGRWD